MIPPLDITKENDDYRTMTTPPDTTGKWIALKRGKGTTREIVVGYLEVFRAHGGMWVTIPGKSRAL